MTRPQRGAKPLKDKRAGSQSGEIRNECKERRFQGQRKGEWKGCWDHKIAGEGEASGPNLFGARCFIPLHDNFLYNTQIHKYICSYGAFYNYHRREKDRRISLGLVIHFRKHGLVASLTRKARLPNMPFLVRLFQGTHDK